MSTKKAIIQGSDSLEKALRVIGYGSRKDREQIINQLLESIKVTFEDADKVGYSFSLFSIKTHITGSREFCFRNMGATDKTYNTKFLLIQ